MANRAAKFLSRFAVFFAAFVTVVTAFREKKETIRHLYTLANVFQVFLGFDDGRFAVDVFLTAAGQGGAGHDWLEGLALLADSFGQFGGGGVWGGLGDGFAPDVSERIPPAHFIHARLIFDCLRWRVSCAARKREIELEDFNAQF